VKETLFRQHPLATRINSRRKDPIRVSYANESATIAPGTIGSATGNAGALPSKSEWRSVVAPYEHQSTWRAVGQLFNTLAPLCAMFYIMYRSLAYPYWVTLLLALPTAGFLVRTFVLMHDCSHGSFFRWRRLNEIVGFWTGVLTLTPFARWRRDHAMHHASSGDLDRRGHGDVPTLTVREYLARSPGKRLAYRAYRHPLTLILGGPIHVVMSQRLPRKTAANDTPEGRSVWLTNAAALGVFVAFSLWIGFGAVSMIFFPTMYLAASAGVWLFYVQHQFEDTYWKDHKDWDYATAAIRGSSFFKLPAPIQWMTGSIGLHHVHHLSPRIPNYRLQRAHDENELFHDVTVLTFLQSAKTLRLALWDEDKEELISFKELNAREAAGAGQSNS
jgi:omega-6 fatty acid desaturase (delta-12 desaturase)